MSAATVVSQTDSRGSNASDGRFELAPEDDHSVHEDEWTEGDDEEDSEDDGEDDEEDHKNRCDKLFKKIKEDVDFKDHGSHKKGEAFLADTLLEKFAQKYRPDLERALISPSPSGTGGSTLLHYIFEYSHPEEVGILELQLLIRLILKVAFVEKPECILVTARESSHAQGERSPMLYRQILSVQKWNSDGTFIHKAVDDQKYYDLLKAVCHTEGFNGLASALAEAIATPGLNNQTCLHTAIISMERPILDLDLIQLLARKSNDKALLRGNNSGNTPLHEFVNAEKCKIYAKKCTVPLNDCPRCRDPKRSRKQITDGKVYKDRYIQTLRILVDQCPDAMMTLNKAHESPYLFNKATRARAKLPNSSETWVGLEFATQHQSTATHANSMAKHQNERKQTAAPGEKMGGNAAKANPKKHQAAKLEYFGDLAAEVAQFLLEEALSTDDYAKTCTSLLGNLKQLSDPEREFKFISTPLTDMTIDIRESMKLEPILAHVELDLVLEQQPVPASTTTKAAEDSWARERNKREDRVLDLFEWLRAKGVKRIVKLTVDDHPDLPCQDKTIKKCLEGFDIRNLDWNKDDIYVPMLREGAQNLRELWLSWSGRGSTLLGWANKDQGLPALPHLRAIHMSVRKGFESDECNEMYIKNFKELLDNGNPKAPIALKSLTDSQRGPLEGGLSTSFSQQNDIWTETVDRFQRTLRNSVTPDFRKKMNPIRVAVIDDGVSLEEIESAGRFRGWQPDPVPLPHKGSNAWYYSKSGHGTEMVHIIQRICPFAYFFIGKLDIRTRSFKSVAASAAEAIIKAIENRCDIITMSWTIYETFGEADSADIDALNKAVNQAADAKIILYCAGQDQGQYEQSMGKPRPWPASSTTNVLKKIGSSKSFGKEADSVNLKNVDYLFPGTLAHRQSAATSSSAATALAAGVAALILWCAEACRVQEQESRPGEKPAALTNAINVINLNKAVPSEGHQGMLVPYVNFREDQRMNTLFDKLKTDQSSASLVDVTGILDAAAKMEKGCPKTVVKMCQDKLQ